MSDAERTSGAGTAGTPEDGDRTRRWLVVAAIVVLVVVAGVAVAWGASQRGDASEYRAQRDRQRDAVLVASGFVEGLMSYDFEDLGAQQAAVERFATEDFRTEYADAFTSEVRDQIVAEEASSTVSVEDVFVTTGDRDELRAIVHARSVVTSGRGATAELESYLQIRLVRLDGRWKVDDLTSLGSRDLSPPLGRPEDETNDEADG